MKRGKHEGVTQRGGSVSPWERVGLYYTRHNPPEHPHNTSRTTETGEDYLAQWTGVKQTKRRLYD